MKRNAGAASSLTVLRHLNINNSVEIRANYDTKITWEESKQTCCTKSLQVVELRAGLNL